MKKQLLAKIGVLLIVYCANRKGMNLREFCMA